MFPPFCLWISCCDDKKMNGSNKILYCGSIRLLSHIIEGWEKFRGCSWLRTIVGLEPRAQWQLLKIGAMTRCIINHCIWRSLWIWGLHLWPLCFFFHWVNVWRQSMDYGPYNLSISHVFNYDWGNLQTPISFIHANKFGRKTMSSIDF